MEDADRRLLRTRSLEILEAAWRPPGFCVPNPTTYPWQWLWDSCFHAVAWAALDRPDRAVAELATALAPQSTDGFVPHLTYHGDPEVHAGLWGRSATSSITQPPIHAHALAQLRRSGVEPPADLVDRSARHVEHLLEVRPRHASGLVAVLHPWETGCDDSPRWDRWGCADRAAWRRRKGELVASIAHAPDTGAPVTNPSFAVGSAGFTALVAHASAELAELLDDGRWRARADELAAALDERWDPAVGTWTDAGPDGPIGARTLDGLLPLLVTRRGDAAAEVTARLLDPAAYGGACGPAGVHRAEPTFDPDRYWRGAAWPQLTYLLWVAAGRRGDGALADELAARLRRGALRSGFAEHWHPDSGQPGGAAPQSWTTLAAVV